jgi:hypothetical protein
MQPRKLTVNEPLGAMGDRRTGLDLEFFFFVYNELRGFHEVSIYQGRLAGESVMATTKGVLSP